MPKGFWDTWFHIGTGLFFAIIIGGGLWFIGSGIYDCGHSAGVHDGYEKLKSSRGSWEAWQRPGYRFVTLRDGDSESLVTRRELDEFLKQKKAN